MMEEKEKTEEPKYLGWEEMNLEKELPLGRILLPDTGGVKKKKEPQFLVINNV